VIDDATGGGQIHRRPGRRESQIHAGNNKGSWRRWTWWRPRREVKSAGGRRGGDRQSGPGDGVTIEARGVKVE
jgi:hypothetical protein